MVSTTSEQLNDAFFERYPETLVAVKHNLKNLGSAVKREIGIAEAHQELVDKDEFFQILTKR